MQRIEPPAPGHAWYAVAVLTIAYMIAFADRHILSLLVQPIRQDLELSDTGVSLLGGAAFALFYSIMGLPLGRVADRSNRKRLVLLGVCAWSAMTVLCGLAKNFWQLFAARVGVGVGEAALSPAAYSMIADYFPPDRLGRAVSVYVMATSIGGGLAMIIGGAVIQLVGSAPPVSLGVFGVVHAWQMAFFAVGLPGFLVALLVLTVREPSRREFTQTLTSTAEPSLRDAARFVLTRRAFYFPHYFGFAVLALFAFGTIAWIPTLLMRTYGWQASEAGYALGGLFLVCGTGGIFAGGWLTDRWHARGRRDAHLRLSVIMCLVMGPVSVAAPLMPTAPLAIALFAVALFCMFLPSAAGPTVLQLVTPNRLRAQVTALFLLISNIVALGTGPTLVALFTDMVFGRPEDLRYSLALLAVTAVPIGAGLLALALNPFVRLRAAT
jgi:MFS family permease